jgi:hypothetical protein
LVGVTVLASLVVGDEWELLVEEEVGDRYDERIGRMDFNCPVATNDGTTVTWYRFEWGDKYVQFKAPRCIVGGDYTDRNIQIRCVSLHCFNR